MILVCGIPSEPPVALLLRELDVLGVSFELFNQRCSDQYDMFYWVANGKVGGRLSLAGREIPLDEVEGVYTRLVDHEYLPEMTGEPPGSARRARWQGLHAALTEWYEVAPARVVNRSRPMASNFSKPYQAQIIARHGFSIPETLITNEPGLVLEFRARHKRVVYKSISSVRSIVSEFCDEDLDRLDMIRWCPVQFQALVEGLDVRVHTVGDTLFATAVYSDAIDYRYSGRTVGAEARLQPMELPDDVARCCLMLARSLGLAMAGIDLKVTDQGEIYCFEVNPSPAYSYYQLETGQPIAAALAQYLAATAAEGPHHGSFY